MEKLSFNGNSPNIKYIQDCIAQLQLKQNTDNNLKTICKFLNKEFSKFGTCSEVVIFKNSNPRGFFGLHIFPVPSQVDTITRKVMDNNYNNKNTIKDCHINYVIEFDSILLYSDATSREITAVLLHEIGHLVISKEPLYRLKSTFNGKLAKLGINISLITATLLTMSAPVLFGLVTYNAFSCIFDRYVSNRKEIDSDSLSAYYGYASDLSSLMEKFENSYEAKRNEIENDVLLNFSISTLFNFKERRTELKKFLEDQLKQNNSPYEKEVIMKQLKAIESREIANDLNQIRLDKLNDLKQNTKDFSESIKTWAQIKRDGFSDLECDEIEIEIDKMVYPEDKIYVITRIHDNITDARKKLEKFGKTNTCKQASQIKDFIECMKGLLEKARIKKINKEVKYDLFIKREIDDYEN